MLIIYDYRNVFTISWFLTYDPIFNKLISFENVNIITCATKLGDNYDPYERITHLEGISGNNEKISLSSEKMIELIESGNYSYYVDVNGRKVKIIVAERLGKKYLKTEADGYEPNNLLALGDCP